MFTLCSCDENSELAPQEEYDVVSTDNGVGNFSSGLRQDLEVPGQNFKLVTEYSCDDVSKREWRITSDKFLYLQVYTEGLPSDTEVYITHKNKILMKKLILNN